MKFKIGDRVRVNPQKLKELILSRPSFSEDQIKKMKSPGKIVHIEEESSVVPYGVSHDYNMSQFTNYWSEDYLELEQMPSVNSVSPFMDGSIYSKGPDGTTGGPSGNLWL